MDGLEQYYSGRLQFLRVDFNSSAGRALAQRYGVRGHPTIVLLDRAEAVQTAIVGVPDPEKVEQAIIAALQ